MKRTALAVLAAGTLILAGCSGDDDDPAEDTSDTGQTEGTGTQGEAELVADATSSAVEYFQARSVHDFDTADDRSSGAAELVIDWDEAVADIEGLEGTPYEIDPVEAPSVRVEISGIEELDDGRLAAEGFVELGQRPDGVATTSTTAPPEGAELDTSTYVTDLVFTRDDGDLRLDDYRFDDVEYPVSELYVEGSDHDDDDSDDTTPGTAPGEATDADDADVHIDYGHRDVDGSVQWVLDHEDDAVIVDAHFIEGDSPPEPGEEGVPLDVFPGEDAAGTTTSGDDDADDADDADDDADDDGDDGDDDDGDDERDGDSLVVQGGAFPGLPGTLRLDVASADGSGQPLVVDVAVLEFPELGQPQPTNVIRDSQADVEDTTTTTEEDDEETTTTTVEESTTTTAGDEPTTTTTAPSTTTTAPTTTTEEDGDDAPGGG